MLVHQHGRRRQRAAEHRALAQADERRARLGVDRQEPALADDGVHLDQAVLVVRRPEQDDQRVAGVVVGLRALPEDAEVVARQPVQLELLGQHSRSSPSGCPTSSQKCSPLASRASTSARSTPSAAVPSACTSVHDTCARSRAMPATPASWALSPCARSGSSRPTDPGRDRCARRASRAACGSASTRAEAVNSPSGPVWTVASTTGLRPACSTSTRRRTPARPLPPGVPSVSRPLRSGSALLEQQQRRRGGVVDGGLAGREDVDRLLDPGRGEQLQERARRGARLRGRVGAHGVRERRGAAGGVRGVAGDERCAARARPCAACSWRSTARSTSA